MTPRQWFAAFAVATTAAGLFAGAAYAQQGVTEAAKASKPTKAAVSDAPVSAATRRQNVEQGLGEPVDAIADAPVAGLYEVQKGGEVFYTDRTGSYLFLGSVVDLKSRQNLTRARVDQIKQASLPQFRFDDLPLETAVKLVKGTGKRRVAIFEDPNCGYCKRLEKSIQDIGNVTIYVFLYPVLGPDSLAKSKQIWCAPDRAKAWNDWMQTATELKGEGACATPIDRTLELGKKFRVDGTPTLFFGNNKRVEGAIDAAELEKNLSAS